MGLDCGDYLRLWIQWELVGKMPSEFSWVWNVLFLNPACLKGNGTEVPAGPPQAKQWSVSLTAVCCSVPVASVWNRVVSFQLRQVGENVYKTFESFRTLWKCFRNTALLHAIPLFLWLSVSFYKKRLSYFSVTFLQKQWCCLDSYKDSSPNGDTSLSIVTEKKKEQKEEVNQQALYWLTHPLWLEMWGTSLWLHKECAWWDPGTSSRPCCSIKGLWNWCFPTSRISWFTELHTYSWRSYKVLVRSKCSSVGWK